MNQTDPSLNVLAGNLNNPNLVVGMYAAMFIEDLDKSQAMKLLPEIEKAQDHPFEFTARVARRLTSELKN
jgi:hypothetical protein